MKTVIAHIRRCGNEFPVIMSKRACITASKGDLYEVESAYGGILRTFFLPRTDLVDAMEFLLAQLDILCLHSNARHPHRRQRERPQRSPLPRQQRSPPTLPRRRPSTPRKPHQFPAWKLTPVPALQRKAPTPTTTRTPAKKPATQTAEKSADTPKKTTVNPKKAAPVSCMETDSSACTPTQGTHTDDNEKRPQRSPLPRQQRSPPTLPRRRPSTPRKPHQFPAWKLTPVPALQRKAPTPTTTRTPAKKPATQTAEKSADTPKKTTVNPKKAAPVSCMETDSSACTPTQGTHTDDNEKRPQRSPLPRQQRSPPTLPRRRPSTPRKPHQFPAWKLTPVPALQRKAPTPTTTRTPAKKPATQTAEKSADTPKKTTVNPKKAAPVSCMETDSSACTPTQGTHTDDNENARKEARYPDSREVRRHSQEDDRQPQESRTSFLHGN
ncbi:hypothetical protein FQA39_LY11852 [Lamprigera yunnana]|nr:hypothetical protein FQA39_LY11852 [Lamprigera yunnana]